MNRLLMALLFSAIPLTDVGSAELGGEGLYLALGGCVIKMPAAIDLVSRTETETKFISRSDHSSIFVFADHDPSIYADKELLISNKESKKGVNVLRLTINSSVNQARVNGTDFAYLHDSVYSLSVYGAAAPEYWNILRSRELLANDCLE